jgi:Protein of unknown function (DUF3631)
MSADIIAVTFNPEAKVGLPAVQELSDADMAAIARAEAVPDGDPVLKDVETFLGQHVIFPTEAARVATTLWVAHTHLISEAECTPYLRIQSAEPRSGKTRLLEVAQLLTPRPLPIANTSVAALFHEIEKTIPTLYLDEMDAIFSPKNAANGINEDLRAMLNAGFRRGMGVLRMVGEGGAGGSKIFPVFCAKALSGLKELPDTLASRSIIIQMKRRAKGEKVERFSVKRTPGKAKPIHTRLAEWAEKIKLNNALSDPKLPEELSDRAQDAWEPLLAIANAAGGNWPERARAAALELSGAEMEDTTFTISLLADIKGVWKDEEDELESKTVVDRLAKLDERPWATYGRDGSGLNTYTLAKLLKPYGISTQFVGAKRVKRLVRANFEDAWDRYLNESTELPTVTDSADHLPF